MTKNSATTRNRSRSEVSMLLVAVIWGMNFVAMKTLFTEVSPGNLILFRFFASAILFLPFFFVVETEIPPLKDLLQLCFLGLVGVTIYQFFWTYAIKYTSVVNVSVIIFSAPLSTTILSAVLGMEKLTIKRLFAVAAGFLGVCIIVMNGGVCLDGSHVKGNLFAVCGSLVWSFYTLLSKPLLNKHSPLKVAVYSMTAAAFSFLPASRWRERRRKHYRPYLSCTTLPASLLPPTLTVL